MKDKDFTEILETVRVAALCHDLGHGPFSHIFEDACNSLNEEGKCEKFSHEDMSARIIQERLSDKIKEPITADDVIDILLGRNEELMFLTSIIDGPYDVDKLDYVSRDAYHTGASEYGVIDYVRIIDGFRVKDGKLLISSSALGAVIDSFTATQYMYSNVYYHKTARIFDFMIYEAMRMIPDFLNEIITDLNTFIEIEDQNFISNVKKRICKSDGENDYKNAYNILRDVLNRKKRYENVFRYYVTLDVSSSKDNCLEKLKSHLESKYADLKTKVDYTARVKPIRIDTKKFYDWMEGNYIYDETTHQAKNLSDVNLAYFEMLKKLQILFCIYVDKKIASRKENIKRKEELRAEAEAQIKCIQGF